MGDISANVCWLKQTSFACNIITHVINVVVWELIIDRNEWRWSGCNRLASWIYSGLRVEGSNDANEVSLMFIDNVDRLNRTDELCTNCCQQRKLTVIRLQNCRRNYTSPHRPEHPKTIAKISRPSTSAQPTMSEADRFVGDIRQQWSTNVRLAFAYNAEL